MSEGGGPREWVWMALIMISFMRKITSTVSRDVGMTRLSDVSAVFVDQLTSLYKELTRRRLSLPCCSSIYNSITYSTPHSTVAPSTQYYAQ